MTEAIHHTPTPPRVPVPPPDVIRAVLTLPDGSALDVYLERDRLSTQITLRLPTGEVIPAACVYGGTVHDLKPAALFASTGKRTYNAGVPHYHYVPRGADPTDALAASAKAAERAAAVAEAKALRAAEVEERVAWVLGCLDRQWCVLCDGDTYGLPKLWTEAADAVRASGLRAASGAVWGAGTAKNARVDYVVTANPEDGDEAHAIGVCVDCYHDTLYEAVRARLGCVGGRRAPPAKFQAAHLALRDDLVDVARRVLELEGGAIAARISAAEVLAAYERGE